MVHAVKAVTPFLYLVIVLIFEDGTECAESGCSGITIVPRSDWGVGSAKGDQLTTPVEYVFIHHTDGATCTDQKSCSSVVKEIFNHHTKTNKWDDIGYSFLVGGDGKIYEGRGWDKVGAHTFGWNSRAVAISFMGKYNDKTPSDLMQDAAKKLIQCGISKKKVKSDYGLYGHRDGTCTTCPGDDFYATLKNWDKWHSKGKIEKFCSG